MSLDFILAIHITLRMFLNYLCSNVLSFVSLVIFKIVQTHIRFHGQSACPQEFNFDLSANAVPETADAVV